MRRTRGRPAPRAAAILVALSWLSAGCAPAVKLSPHQRSLQSSQACVRAEYGRTHQSIHDVLPAPTSAPTAPGASPELVRILRAAGISLPQKGDYVGLTATLIQRDGQACPCVSSVARV